MGKFEVVRDVYGFAAAIKYGEQWICHLNVGTVINEYFIQTICDLLNTISDTELAERNKELAELKDQNTNAHDEVMMWVEKCKSYENELAKLRSFWEWSA